MKMKSMAQASILSVVLTSVLTGCATFGNSQRLHDIWGLETMNGKELELSSERQRPRMEINLQEMKVSGFDGCNNYLGPIEDVGFGDIAFGQIAVTRRFCTDMATPDQFDSNLGEVQSYSLQELKLYFYDDEGNELFSFQKTD
ncbi:META domain-containing protein [Marinobacter salinexigens]|uniref:META domain-containing protein n=1 Tax=Marinobacter salinexigens TaxID=2919747 RepID=A0A5B0VGS4_9GAMM|nr:META domain-containing protein [Marinobacter salinexigens]KAA1173826.1 META domain-containing protein [Marinobacter salinexigens]